MAEAPATLSPELASPYEVALRNLDSLIAWALEHDYERTRNEATTRLHLIDTLLRECLAWPTEEITAEVHESGEYADYVLGRDIPRGLIEAKREGRYFEILPGFESRSTSLKTFKTFGGELWSAVEQALGYCQRRGIPVGAVCNGHQIIAFIGSRNDGIAPADGRAIVFSSLEDMREGFADLWTYLSKPGLEGQRLYARLQGASQPPPPDKLSQHISGYPGHKIRNQLQSELQILGGLFLEDVAQAPTLQRDFLEKAYCPSGALSQYALVSREILQTRYDAFFQDAGDITQQPAQTKKGIADELSADILAAAVSRRPIILLGDVGVGKTTFIRRLIAVDARELFERAITLYVDFGTRPALATEIEGFVRDAFIEQLRGEYEIDIYERNFVHGVYHGEIERFSRGIYGDLRESDPSQYRQHELKMLADLIDRTETHLRAALDHITKAQRRQVVIFLDNVDQRPLAFQEQVFLVAQSLATHWTGTVFVSLRPETFYRSRTRGSLAAYQPRVFTIAPPRVDLVLRRRLEFAKRQLDKTGTLGPLAEGTTIRSSALDAYIQALIYSLEANRDLIELIDNLSGGNTREALNFLTQFVGSGHVDSAKIVSAVEETGRYTVPVHEFLRAIIFGDNEHFDPESSPIANLFDISLTDSREHFLLPILLEFVTRAGDSGHAEGFVTAGAIFGEGQRLGFVPSQIEAALQRAVDKRLLEGNLRGLMFGEVDRYRITTVGAYTVKRLPRLFTYVDAMTVDTPITDDGARGRIVNVWSIGDRLLRTDVFRRYLDASSTLLSDSDPPFDWSPTSAALEDDIERIALRTAS